jgi:hypothetical protein
MASEKLISGVEQFNERLAQFEKDSYPNEIV